MFNSLMKFYEFKFFDKFIKFINNYKRYKI